MSNPELQRSIEAILMVVDEPVTEMTLAHVLGKPVEEITQALSDLCESYGDRGFELKAIMEIGRSVRFRILSFISEQNSQTEPKLIGPKSSQNGV